MKQTRNFLAVAIVVHFGGNCNEKDYLASRETLGW